MKQKICRLILKIIGWKTVLTVEIPDKCVFCVAPHTSNTDLFIGKLAYCAMGGERPSFLIKKEWFRFPFNLIFGSLGGIPVDRQNKNSLTDQIVEIFHTRTCFQLAITPEGTRKANADWKKGFYYISLKAQVPILLTYIDFGTKTVGIERVFIPAGNEEKDMNEIKSYFNKFKGKHPERFII